MGGLLCMHSTVALTPRLVLGSVCVCVSPICCRPAGLHGHGGGLCFAYAVQVVRTATIVSRSTGSSKLCTPEQIPGMSVTTSSSFSANPTV